MTEPFSAELTRSRRLSESTMDFRFLRTDGKPVVFEPGQFFRFAFTDSEGTFERPYSLCNFTDASAQEMDLVISTVEEGRASKHLFHCDPGIKATVTGPHGRLLVPNVLPDRLFLVATSVGIAPFLPMLSGLKSANARVVFLFGVRDRSEFLYGDEMLALQKDWPNLTLQVCYSRKVSGLKDFEKLGYVTTFVESFEPDPGTDHFLLCGNPHMIDNYFTQLKALGFSARQVTREKYVFAHKPKSRERPDLSAEQRKLIADKLRKYSR